MHFFLTSPLPPLYWVLSLFPSQANVRVNFGPRFIKRPDLAGVHPVSDLQPLSQEERKVSRGQGGVYVVCWGVQYAVFGV
jgi:hypothetical protein